MRIKPKPQKRGHPTDYEPDYCNRVDEYLQSCGKEQTTLPTKEGFAVYLGHDTDSLVEWVKKYPDFSVAIKRIEAAQKIQLMSDGMYGGKEVNSTMAIFLLKVNHNMIETEKRILAGDENNPIKIDVGGILEKVYGNKSDNT